MCSYQFVKSGPILKLAIHRKQNERQFSSFQSTGLTNQVSSLIWPVLQEPKSNQTLVSTEFEEDKHHEGSVLKTKDKSEAIPKKLSWGPMKILKTFSKMCSNQEDIEEHCKYFSHSKEVTHSHLKYSLILLLLFSIEVLAVSSGCHNWQTSKTSGFTKITAPECFPFLPSL